MDGELKDLLVSMETRLSARVQQSEDRLMQYTGQQTDQLSQRLEDLGQRLTQYTDQRVERAETNLLTAFHGWARSMEIRTRGITTIVSGFDERLSMIEERVSELERRKAS